MGIHEGEIEDDCCGNHRHLGDHEVEADAFLSQVPGDTRGGIEAEGRAPGEAQGVDRGAGVVVIEHNLDVIKMADYIIDLGPEGGEAGGRIVAEGTPEVLAACDKSYTGQSLKSVLNRV